MILSHLLNWTIFIVFYVWPVSNVCTTELLSTTNLSNNGDFEQPPLGMANYLVGNGNLAGWTSTSNEIGKGTWYNSRWGTTQVVELATTN